MKAVLKSLEKFDDEDFKSFSAANTKVPDSLVPTVFDWVPEELNRDDEYVLGIDEAGRGPVLGPMVYSAAWCRLDKHQSVRDDIGANDSKQLKEIDRERMLKSIDSSNWVAYTGQVLPPSYISSSMLARRKYNLNQMSHDTAIAMINRAIDHHKFKIKEVYVDTVGKAETYQEKLQNLFPRLHISVESKADATYPIVGAASIVAKVTRDHLVHNWQHLESGIDSAIPTGSGYPGDPKTKAWLHSNLDQVFGLPGFARISWQTSQDIIAKNCIAVKWEDEEEEEGEEEDGKSQSKLRAGSKRSKQEVAKAVPKRKSQFFRENKLSRADLTNFMKAF